MGLFWDYFKRTLGLPFIQAPGPLALLAEGGATTLDDARGVIVQLREQFLAEKCEAAFLVNYARSRGIVRGPQEPEAYFIQRVRFAYLWWSRGGRAGAMAAMLVSYFGVESVEVISLRAEDPLRWAEFRVVAYLVGETAWFTVDQFEWAINEMKRAGAKLAGIDFVYSVAGDVPVYSAGVTSAEIITVFMAVE